MDNIQSDNTKNSKINSKNISNKQFVAGDVKFWIEGWSADKLEAPISFRYNESLTELTWTFSLEIPDTDKYAFAKLPLKECRLFLDGVFFVGGYAVKYKEGESSFQCDFIGYGYQVSKLTLLKALDISLNVEESIRNFVYISISENISTARTYNDNLDLRVIGGEIKKQSKLANIASNYLDLTSLSYLNRGNKKIRFIIYDPFDLGSIALKAYINSEQMKQKDEPNLMKYISKVLKPFNVFIKSLGKFSDVKNMLDYNSIYPKQIYNLFDEENYEIFVLMLWQPNCNNLNQTTFRYIDTINETSLLNVNNGADTSLLLKNGDGNQINYYFNKKPISNFLVPNQTLFDAVNLKVAPKYEKAYSILGFQTYRTNEKDPNVKTFIRSYQSISNIVNINYINNSLNSTLFEKPKRNWDFSERYDTIVVSNTETEEEGKTDEKGKTKETVDSQKASYVFVKDNDLNDGTTFFQKLDNKFKSTANGFLAYYEMSLRKTKSFTISCRTIGYHQEQTQAMLQTGNKSKMKPFFYGVNQLVKLYSPSQNLNNYFLIDKISMNFDNSNGYYCDLSLVIPNAYSTILYEDIEREIDSLYIQQNQRDDYTKRGL